MRCCVPRIWGAKVEIKMQNCPEWINFVAYYINYNMNGKPTAHPKGLYLLFATEMWERFSYYGMRAIFVLYMIKALLFDKELASSIYGSYTGLVYLTPLIGGYMADRYWGNRRSILTGGVLMAIGQFCMFLSASFYTEVQLATCLMFAGLGLLIFGNGFFKPNITTMVGQLYADQDPRSDAAYTIFYMGINLGAFFSPLVCGTLGETGEPSDFRWGFLAACIGMIIGVVCFKLLQNKYLVTPTGRQIGVEPNVRREAAAPEAAGAGQVSGKKQATEFLLWGGVAVALYFVFRLLCRFDGIGSAIFALYIAVPCYIITDRTLTREERDRVLVIYIISFFVIFFWAAFEQAGASLTYFADEQTNRMIFGWEMPASYFQTFNALFIVTLAPVFAWLWPVLNRHRLEPASVSKQAIGLFLLSLGYLLIAVGVRGVAPGVKVSMFWLVGLYFLHTIGELCLSPIGLSMVNKLAPVRFASLLMGVWFLSTATANKFAGMLSGLYPEFDETTGELIRATSFCGHPITGLYDFFMIFVVMAGVAAIVLGCLTGWLQKKMHGVN